MSPLLTARIEFTRNIPRLIDRAFEMGYLATVGDVFRDSRCTYGKKHSKHWDGLAIDLNLYLPGGIYLRDTRDHAALGTWWESIGGVWGGRWMDGNHYEWPVEEGGQPDVQETT
jgi:hypothetical protein